jgi:cytochrome b subunit of formate dehydrogenase/mono/diheme cytochrome c family protein
MSATTYQRFTLPQRAEHIVMLASFTILAVTGLPQKFIAAGWAQTMIGWMGGIETTRQIHHFAAIVLMLGSVYHLAAVGYRMLVRHVRLTMLPGLRDVNEALGAFLFNLGLRKQAPQSGRYSYAEKAEYWAFVWGTVVMIITGFMMWNPIATAAIFPGQFIPAAKAAHGGEAILAVLAIIVWHFYHVHLRTFNKSMWTGKMTEHEMIEEHPLELADIKAGVADTSVEPALLKKRQQIYYPVAGILAAALLFGVYRFVTFEETAIETVPQRREQIAAFAPLTPTPLPTPRPTPTSAALQAVWDGNIGNLLLAKCGECHGSIAGLDISTYQTAMKGGNGGPLIVAGDPDNSLIIIKQSKKHPGQLSEEELKVLTDWIVAGAPEK